MKNKFLCLLISVVMVLTMLSAFVLTVGAANENVSRISPAPSPTGPSISSGPSVPAPDIPSISIDMYSSQVRAVNTKLSNPKYYELENGTVWVMSEEGFTESQKSSITAEVYEWGITHDPIVPAWVARPGTE